MCSESSRHYTLNMALGEDAREQAKFHLENALACLEMGAEECAETNAIEAQSILEGVKFADLIESKDYIELSEKPHVKGWGKALGRNLQFRQAMAEISLRAWEIEEGDIVEYMFYPDPHWHRAIVAWNNDEGQFVLQTFREEEVNYFKEQGMSDYCTLENVYDIRVEDESGKFPSDYECESTVLSAEEAAAYLVKNKAKNDEEAIDRAMNAMCYEIQNYLGVTDGGFADRYFSGNREENIRNIMQKYIDAERKDCEETDWAHTKNKN